VEEGTPQWVASPCWVSRTDLPRRSNPQHPYPACRKSSFRHRCASEDRRNHGRAPNEKVLPSVASRRCHHVCYVTGSSCRTKLRRCRSENDERSS